MSAPPPEPGSSAPVEAEARLASLGIHRIPLPVPFPDAGGPVNVYVLEEADGFSLFDSGIGTEEGESGLVAGLTTLGLSLAHLRHVYVSHGHVDHYGLAALLAERSDAMVHVHPADWDKVVAPRQAAAQRALYHPYLKQLGVPEDQLVHFDALNEASESAGRRVPPERLRPLEPGTRLQFRHFEASVLHFPGHTPGLIALHVPAEKLLLADDHVLARISPNPLLDLSQGVGPEKFRSLARYLESAKRVLELPLEWVLPGHGAPFQNADRVLEGLFRFYERRQRVICEHLREQSVNPYELIPLLFETRNPIQLFLMMSEVVGNLEVLEDAGRVTRTLDGGIYRFRAAA